MIRGLFYFGLIAIVAISVYWKIGVIKEKRNAPTVSIANEFKEHGKPVETYQAKRADLKFYERVTGFYSNRQVNLTVSKIQWNKITTGQKARILSPKDKVVPGVVSWKASFPDTSTGLYRVIVKSKAPMMVDPGQNVVVDVNVDTLKNVVFVPSASIERAGKDAFVWVLTEQRKALKRKVRVGKESQMFTQIVDGLQVGEKIIVRGASSLEKGDVARVISGEEE